MRSSLGSNNRPPLSWHCSTASLKDNSFGALMASGSFSSFENKKHFPWISLQPSTQTKYKSNYFNEVQWLYYTKFFEIKQKISHFKLSCELLPCALKQQFEVIHPPSFLTWQLLVPQRNPILQSR